MQPMPYPAVTGPTLLGAGAMATNGTTAAAAQVPHPAGMLANDIGFLQGCIINATSSDSVATPSGWTLIDQSIMAGTASYFHALFWKRMAGGETGNVAVNLTPAGVTSTDNLFCRMTAFRGCIASGTPYEALAQSTAQNASMAGAAVTTLGPNRKILNFCAADFGRSSSPASGWAELYDQISTSGSADGSLALYSIDKAIAGLLAAATHPLSGSARWQVKSLALIPA